MQNIQLSYTFAPQAVGESAGSPVAGRITNPDITLLAAVRQQGSISAAARALGISYRHAWGSLKRWEQALGQAVLVWDRGQAATLSAFGLQLLHAEQLAQARLAPQIEALHAELTRSLAVAFNPNAQVLQMHASHDEALGLLQRHCAVQDLHLDASFTGSVDAIRALNEGRCTLAGFHTVLPAPRGSVAQYTYQNLLTPGLHKLIGFATRAQGLIVAPGNPLGLHSLADVAAQQARFVNRALGTGTRVLIEELLASLDLTSGQIAGWQNTQPSHAAVAQAVRSKQADAGVGIEPAARALGLDFIPLATERYDLVCLKSTLDDPAMQTLRRILQAAPWQNKVNALPGYSANQSGQVLSLSATLDWWSF